MVSDNRLEIACLKSCETEYRHANIFCPLKSSKTLIYVMKVISRKSNSWGKLFFRVLTKNIKAMRKLASQMMDKGVILAVSAVGQAIGQALYNVGLNLYENHEIYIEYVKGMFKKEEQAVTETKEVAVC